MPLGVGLAIGVVGGAVAGKAFGGGGSSSSAPPQAQTSNLVDQATKTAPPGAIQGASDATAQAGVAGMKQKKRAAAGDTILTPPANGTGSATPVLQPKTLLGS